MKNLWKRWTQDDINFLQQNYLKMSNKELANVLDRSESAIESQLFKLGLKRPLYRPLWNEKDIQFLVNNYLEKRTFELAKILNKTPRAISHKITRLGLKRPKEFYKGRKLSEEHKRKIGLAHKGRKLPKKHIKKMRETMKKLYKEGKYHTKSYSHLPEVRKKISKILKEGYKSGRIKHNKSMKGKKHSEETKRKIGLPQRGEGNHAWLGGISFEPYGLEFNDRLKEQIRMRDGFRCQQCFRHEGELRRKLNVHHIDFKKRNNHPNNLISLCDNCHGQTQFNRKDWTKYFQNKMKEDSKI